MYYQKYVCRDIQSKYLKLRDMKIPKMEEIKLSIGVADASKFLPAYIALEMISGRKPLPVAKAQTGINGPIDRVKTSLHDDAKYSFYDNFINIYLPTLKKSELQGNDPIFQNISALLFENLVAGEEVTKFKISSVHYFAPVEREFQRFLKAEAQDLELDVEIRIKNPIPDEFRGILNYAERERFERENAKLN